MKTITKAYYYRLYPTEKQKKLLEIHFGSVRYVYNYFLQDRIDSYRKTGKSNFYKEQSKLLTELKKEKIWLNKPSSVILLNALKTLDNNYKKFIFGKGKFPEQWKKKDINKFFIQSGIQIKDKRIQIPKFKEGIKFVEHIKFDGKIKYATLSKTKSGKYYISISVETKHKPKKKTNDICGVDLGLRNFCVNSDGCTFPSTDFFLSDLPKYHTAIEHLNRKKPGSNGYEKQVRKAARISEKIVNRRRDYIHKISDWFVTYYDVICIENLDVKEILKNGELRSRVYGAAWGTFVKHLYHKAIRNNKVVSRVDKYYPSSKICSECGDYNKNLSPYETTWVCRNGHHLNRDENAAMNILKEGMRIYRQGLAITG